jgi:formylglycine-generating enzyme required for sulfatase activity
MIVEALEPGPVSYELRLPGHQPTTLSGEVLPGGQLFLGARLNRRPGPRRDEPWENSLQMKFAPLGSVLCGVWPVRVRDYDAFCQATGRERQKQDFPQDPTHPVVRVNYDDATAFCAWLTQKETQAGLLEAGQLYRLPTDAEWSEAAGLPPENGATPEERDGKLPDYPWGRQWPPPAGAGNYADSSQRGATLRIPNYRDGFPQTSPVGSFAPNARGLCDISGNVWQWVQDSYKGNNGPRGKEWGVLRGGSWGTSRQAELRSSYRNVVDRTERDVIFGFRAVLVPEP